MTAKHTPGPWTAEPNGTAEEGFNIEGSRNAYVAFVASEDDNHSVEEAYANARLIAEAPAMYKALETVRSYTRTMIEARCFVEEPWMRDLNALLDRVELP